MTHASCIPTTCFPRCPFPQVDHEEETKDSDGQITIPVSRPRSSKASGLLELGNATHEQFEGVDDLVEQRSCAQFGQRDVSERR
jgi:hypothetical protein